MIEGYQKQEFDAIKNGIYCYRAIQLSIPRHSCSQKT